MCCAHAGEIPLTRVTPDFIGRTRAGNDLLGQAGRYAVVGGSGYLLAIAFYALELAVGVPPYPAIVVVFVLNGLYNFALIRVWAFPASGLPTRTELLRFVCVAAGSLVINYGTFALLYSAIGVRALPAQAVAIAVAAPFGFLANRAWSFGGHDNRDPRTRVKEMSRGDA
jgi:putative flippase GtrA